MWSLTNKWIRVMRITKPVFRYECVESLYSAASLGLDRYSESKAKTVGQFANFTDKYRSKMQDFVKDDKNNMIFTEDLRNMIYLATKDDIGLLELMIKKFNHQNKELRFGNFIFGPVVMRMYHDLGLPDAALKIFEAPETAGFFDQIISFQILMNLLFINKKYDDVIKVFEYTKKKQLNMNKYPKNIVVLIMATYYKQNTKESLQNAISLWTDLLTVGHEPLKKATTFFAGLAINQNSPHIALEALSNVREQKYITIRNLKAIALADLDRPGDIIPILRQTLDQDLPTSSTKLFTQDTIDKIEESVKRLGNKDIEREFAQISKYLNDQIMIQAVDIDTILCQDINYTSPRQNLQNSQYQNTNPSFNRYNNRNNDNRMGRQGLNQMY